MFPDEFVGKAAKFGGHSLNRFDVIQFFSRRELQTLPLGLNTVKVHLIATGLAQSVERLTAEREVAGSIPGTGPILRVLK